MFQVDPYSRAIPTAQGHSCGIGMRMRNAAYHASWPDRLTPRTDGHLEGWNAQCSEGLACGQSAEVKLRLTLANASSDTCRIRDARDGECFRRELFDIESTQINVQSNSIGRSYRETLHVAQRGRSLARTHGRVINR